MLSEFLLLSVMDVFAVFTTFYSGKCVQTDAFSLSNFGAYLLILTHRHSTVPC